MDPLMNLEITANKIVSKYINAGTDMNDSIAKYAMENSLNIEQTKRLVEESNKNCYLQKFASTGEQIFDVAQYNIVKEKVGLVDKVEKTAAIRFMEAGEFEKVANEQIDTLEYDGAIAKVRSEIGSTLVKMASLRKNLVYKNASLEKLAFNEIEELKPLVAEIEHKEKIIDYLIEKRAGGFLSGLASGAIKAGTWIGTKVAKNPGKLLIAAGTVGSFEQGAKKVMPSENFLLSKTAEMEKEAFKLDGAALIKLLEQAAVPALAMGAVGLSVATARGTGSIISRMMKERQLNESFNTISQANADIRQIPNARAYFDVVARHSPDLANDPMVAPQLIRQFDTFGGVDVNTIGKLREIEGLGRKDRPRGTGSFETAGNLASTVSSFAKFNPEAKEEFNSNDHYGLTADRPYDLTRFNTKKK